MTDPHTPIMIALMILAFLLCIIAVFWVGFAIGAASAAQQLNETGGVFAPRPRRRMVG